jgi:hypothetical protein
MNQTVRFVKTCGKFDISAIFGDLQNRLVPAINIRTPMLERKAIFFLKQTVSFPQYPLLAILS